MDQHAAGLGWIAILHLFVTDRLLVGACEGDIVEKGALVLINPDPVGQPIFVPAQPWQQGRDIRAPSLGIGDLINGELQYFWLLALYAATDAGVVPGAFGVLWIEDALRVEVRWIAAGRAIRGQGSAMHAHNGLDVLRVGLNLVDDAGVNLPDLYAAIIGIHKKADKLFS